MTYRLAYGLLLLDVGVLRSVADEPTTAKVRSSRGESSSVQKITLMPVSQNYW